MCIAQKHESRIYFPYPSVGGVLTAIKPAATMFYFKYMRHTAAHAIDSYLSDNLFFNQPLDLDPSIIRPALKKAKSSATLIEILRATSIQASQFAPPKAVATIALGSLSPHKQ